MSTLGTIIAKEDDGSYRVALDPPATATMMPRESVLSIAAAHLHSPYEPEIGDRVSVNYLIAMARGRGGYWYASVVDPTATRVLRGSSGGGDATTSGAGILEIVPAPAAELGPLQPRSLEEAIELRGKIEASYRTARRWLEVLDLYIASDMQARNATEIRLGRVLYEFKPTYEWRVDVGPLLVALAPFVASGVVNQREVDRAIRSEPRLYFHANNGRLNELCRRGGELAATIGRYRHRVELPARLKIKEVDALKKEIGSGEEEESGD